MRNLKHCAVALLLVLMAVPAMSQTLTGTITGTVKDEQGGVLPGATVTLIGKTGVRTATTDAQGQYRFPVIEPGTYALLAELSGFKSRKQDNIAISIGKQINLDFALGVGGVTETIEVVGEAPVVDTTSAASNNSLSQDILYNMPLDRRSFNIQEFAPGVNGGSAFGGAADYGNALLLDGVDTRDPEGGSAWTFFNYDIIEEVQIQGLGAPAEYGAFTGGIVNTITKSGGNAFAGLFDAYYTRANFGASNTADVATANPALADPAKVSKYIDITGQLSGPIIPDKLFFFVSAQRFNKVQDPTGPRTTNEELSHRMNLKLTYQPSANDHFMLSGQFDDYSIWGRPGQPGTLRSNDGQTVQETAPEFVWNAQWRHLFSANTFLEAKYIGWWGYYYLDPTKALASDPYSGSYFSHLDGANNSYTGGGGYYYYADRGRNQVNASLSHFAEGFGKHDLKFGLEIERSTTRSRYGYGPFGGNGCCYYYDYAGTPYYAYQYSYDVQGTNTRFSGFAQDTWKVSDRLTLSPGVRFDWIQGASPSITSGDQKVYDTKSVSPRIGFAFDVTGDHTTVLKAHYGQYYEGAFFYWYNRATPGIGDWITLDPASHEEMDRSPTPAYQMDKNIKQPRVDEFTVGFERALGKDFRVQVTGIYRTWKNMINSVLPTARWSPVTLTTTDPHTGESRTVTAYNWANRSSSETDQLLTNPDGFVYLDENGQPLGTAEAARNYKGLMLVLTKRMTDRWQAQVSYVLSKTEGTVDSFASSAIGQGRLFETPSLALVNSKGENIVSARHEIKAYLSYQVPVIEVGLNMAVRSVSGDTYTPTALYSTRQVNFPFSAGRTVLLEPRGSRRLKMTNIVDLRLEKIFKLGERKDRIGLYADITNLTNSGTVTSAVTRFTGSTFTTVVNGESVDTLVPFEGPAAIVAPRQLTIGARWSF